jgi:hypothetical protein
MVDTKNIATTAIAFEILERFINSEESPLILYRFAQIGIPKPLKMYECFGSQP